MHPKACWQLPMRTARAPALLPMHQPLAAAWCSRQHQECRCRAAAVQQAATRHTPQQQPQCQEQVGLLLQHTHRGPLPAAPAMHWQLLEAWSVKRCQPSLLLLCRLCRLQLPAQPSRQQQQQVLASALTSSGWPPAQQQQQQPLPSASAPAALTARRGLWMARQLQAGRRCLMQRHQQGGLPSAWLRRWQQTQRARQCQEQPCQPPPASHNSTASCRRWGFRAAQLSSGSS
jgi:hypothetical protein